MKKLMRQTKAALIRECVARGLATTGRKADLAARIMADRDGVLVEIETGTADDLVLVPADADTRAEAFAFLRDNPTLAA